MSVVSSTNTNLPPRYITEILLKVALNTNILKKARLTELVKRVRVRVIGI
jgi:hypothetical protein